MPNRHRVMQVVGRVAAVATVFVAALFVGTAAVIGSAVHRVSEAARREEPADRVVALIAYVESPKHTLQERNRAVWALGQLGDDRALPVLQQYFTDQDCDHAHRLCQRELKKAIRLCKGATNVTSALWR